LLSIGGRRKGIGGRRKRIWEFAWKKRPESTAWWKRYWISVLLMVAERWGE
jgi:hypothetical protein